MFAEEQPALGPLPLEPFRYYRYGERTVHLDGCVEVEAAYYGAPPGWIGQRVQVQWNDLHVRLLAPKTGPAAARASARAARLASPPRRRPAGADAGRARSRSSPARRPPARTSAPSATTSTSTTARAGVRRILGVLALAKKHGPAVVDDAAKAALDLGVPTYRFLRRYLERRPAGAADAAPSRPAHSAAHPLSRSHRSQNRRPAMNLVELDRALRQLRLSGHGGRPRNPTASRPDREAHADRSRLDARLRRAPPPTGPPPRAPAQTGALSAIPIARSTPSISISTRR